MISELAEITTWLLITLFLGVTIGVFIGVYWTEDNELKNRRSDDIGD